MGKQRIQALLGKVHETNQQDIHNSAAIFSVAQLAVNKLSEATESGQSVSQLTMPPEALTKAELLDRYQSYAGCRRAAKEQGIKFQKTPSWEKLICAFSYLEAFQKLQKSYLATYPNVHLQGIIFEIKF